ncbi:MAG: acetate--CoA ligase family protein [Dongiaceae bacterium]
MTPHSAVAPPSRADGGRHRLSSLLAPESIAFVGASPKFESVGNGMIRAVRAGGFDGRLYLVNPNYREIDGLPCHPSLAALPETVDHVVIGVANARIESQLAEAIRHGAQGATIFASCYLPDDGDPPLTKRIAAMALAAGLQICGGNGMGFYNLDHALRVCGFPPPPWLERGEIAFITHSGSAFSGLCHTDRRFRFNLAVSAGQELATTVADYLDFALDMPSTRVVGLFLETVRDPAGFVAGLEKAKARDIPVVVLKVGRTAESAALALSHSGALAGNHAAYQAVFDRYGVIEVEDLDGFANCLLLLAQPRRVARGGFATMHDSGGLRELAIDLAVAHGVPYARIGDATKRKLAARLEYGLEPTNPLDAWGTGHDYENIFTDCLQALVDDPDTAIGILCAETRSGFSLHESYARIVQAVAARTDKPVLMSNNLATIGNDDLAVRCTRAGYPVLVGLGPMMTAVRAAFAHRDFRARPPVSPAPAPAGAREHWTPRLRRGDALDEAESLALFADYGIPAMPHHVVESGEAAVVVAGDVGYPVVLKTAMPGILHKSDAGGVRLNLPDTAAVRTAYDDLARRIGPRVLVMPMAGPGTELAFGALDDPQFGPIVMVGAGGILIESMDDRRFALPPFDAGDARRLIDRLRARPLLDGRRGRPPADIDALAEAFACFSVMVADIAGLFQEIDVNPVLCGPQGCIALDALVIGRPHKAVPTQDSR